MGKIPEEADNRMTETFLSIFKTMLEGKEEADTIEWTRKMMKEVDGMKQKAHTTHTHSQVNLSGRIVDMFMHSLKAQLRGVTALYDILEMHNRARRIMEQTISVVLMNSQGNIDEEVKRNQQQLLNENITKWLNDSKVQYDKHR